MDAGELFTNPSKRPERGMIVLGLLSALLLGPLAGVPGLIWSRRLHPFSRSIRIGYFLCWYGCVGPMWLVYLAQFLGQLRQDAGWIQLALMLFFSCFWVAICRKFLVGPARSKRGAFLIAFCGTLFVGGVIVPAGFGSLVLPMLLAIPLYIKLLPIPWWLVAWAFLLPTIFVFPPHLAVYWPVRKNFFQAMKAEK